MATCKRFLNVYTVKGRCSYFLKKYHAVVTKAMGMVILEKKSSLKLNKQTVILSLYQILSFLLDILKKHYYFTYDGGFKL